MSNFLSPKVNSFFESLSAQKREEAEKLVAVASKKDEFCFNLHELKRYAEIIPLIWEERKAISKSAVEQAAAVKKSRIKGQIFKKDEIPEQLKQFSARAERTNKGSGSTYEPPRFDQARLDFFLSLEPDEMFSGDETISCIPYLVFFFKTPTGGSIAIAESGWTGNSTFYFHSVKDEAEWIDVFVDRTKKEARKRGAKTKRHVDNFEQNIKKMLKKYGIKR